MRELSKSEREGMEGGQKTFSLQSSPLLLTPLELFFPISPPTLEPKAAASAAAAVSSLSARRSLPPSSTHPPPPSSHSPSVCCRSPGRDARRGGGRGEETFSAASGFNTLSPTGSLLLPPHALLRRPPLKCHLLLGGWEG